MTAKDIIKITLNLVVVYLIGGLLLAGVYAKTSPIMYKNAIVEKERALKKLLPDADKIEKLGDWKIHEKPAEYYIANKAGKPIGYIIQSYGKGYSSYINVLIALDTNLKVLKIDILSHAETPGLGDEIETPDFKNQFVGKGLEQIRLVKGETKENIQAITGVTISSRAVTDDAVKNAVAFLTKVIKSGG
ncbi:MAG: RnfABCDGE type electron transport complex subunit G [Thermodesulfovibrionales bacterium]|nr:RnfABCDGE type electron transport complex subunit G [Thermodesulfovibrionales bacterium]